MTETEREIFAGKTADGDRVYVSVRLGVTSRTAETVTHEAVTEVTRLSMTGAVFEPWKRDASSAGQCTEALTEITEPASGLTLEAIEDMAAVWDRWHLNDLQAGCAHQEVVWETGPYGYRQPSLDLTPRCPETGYLYGHGWLYEPLPSDVLQRVSAFIDTGEWVTR